MKIYSPSNNFKLDKVLFASKLLGKKLQHLEVSSDYRHKQFIAQFPHYSLPALELTDNEYVFGSHSILLSLYDDKLQAMDPFFKNEIYQWLEMVEKQLESSIGLLVVNKEKIANNQIKQEELLKAKQTVLKAMKIVDDRLKLRTYLCAHSITPADIAVFCGFRALKDSFDQKETKGFVCLKRWMANLQGIWGQVMAI